VFLHESAVTARPTRAARNRLPAFIAMGGQQGHVVVVDVDTPRPPRMRAQLVTIRATVALGFEGHNNGRAVITVVPAVA
jgi:hypothetical protein